MKSAQKSQKINASEGRNALTRTEKTRRNPAVTTKNVVMRFSSRYWVTCSTRSCSGFSMVGHTVRPSGLPVMGDFTGLLTRCCPASRIAAGEGAFSYGGHPLVHVGSSRSPFALVRRHTLAPLARGHAHV